MKKVKKNVEASYEYFEGKSEPESGIYNSSIVLKDMTGIYVSVNPLKYVNHNELSLHFRGDAKSLKSLGEMFIAMADYQSVDPKYYEIFDDFTTEGETSVEFVVYSPHNPKPMGIIGAIGKVDL